jgi:Flp pilus assembly protein TadG
VSIGDLLCRVRDDAGAAAVEFALVLPLLLVMTMGIIEFGRAFNHSHVITDAAREGARRAVVRDGAVKTTVVPAVIQNRLSAAGLTWSGTPVLTTSCAGWAPPSNPPANAVSVYGCGWGAATGTEARVAIFTPYPFNLLSPVMGLIGGSGPGTKMLSSNLGMRNE